jgi:hypothetical protein
VKCRTESELETLKALYEGEFRSVTDQKQHGLLFRTFKKVGLTHADGTILIVDEQRWNAVSMRKRVSTRMPGRTNSIEATHGHLNEAISRRTPFWASLGILYNAIADKTLHFDLALAHDFRGAPKRCRRRSQFLSRGPIQQECARLGTTPDHCSCGETVHLSASYRTDFPRSNRYAMGAQKPEIPPGLGLHVQPSTHAMEYSESVHDCNPQVGWTGEAAEWLRIYALRQIKRFSHAKDRDAILQYIGERPDVIGPSALEIPLALHQLIARGISHFTNASGRQ